MPRPKLNVHEMTLVEVEEKVNELKKELFNLRFRNSMRQLDNPLEIRYLRRDLARLLTALSEHRQGIARLAGDEVGEAVGKKAGEEKSGERT
jgi:large subunit ribosomal protein L29